MIDYIINVLIGLDVLINAILGGQRYQTMSCRIGLSIQDNSWASKIPWPKFLSNHFMDSIFKVIV